MLVIRGTFGGHLVTRLGSISLESRANSIMFRAMDLVAGLLKSNATLDGLTYWAVGSGDPAWDTTPPPTNLRTTVLQQEIYRKRIDPGQISYDPTTKKISINVTFAPHEAVGTWREFGVFGGDASAFPNSGYLFSYHSHPKIEKSEDAILQRTLQLSLDSDLQIDSMLDLIGGLLTNQPNLVGIQYWANGSGDPAWDAAIPPPNKGDKKLAAEVYRKPINPTLDISYQPLTQTVTVKSAFEFDESAALLREFGLFGGNATSAKDSGFLLNHAVHPALDKRKAERLTRQFQLQLGVNTVVAVPNIVGLATAAAATALGTAQLGLGVVTQEENDPGAGKVLGQDPGAGVQVSLDMPVNVTIGILTRRVVPDLTGLTVADATAVLTGLQLALSADPPAKQESSQPPDTILAQSPSPGIRVDQGTAVKITLAQPITTLVPDLTGLAPSEAAIVLQSSNLVLAPPPYPTTDAIDALNTISQQAPSPGSRAIVGSAVVPTIKSMAQVKVPNLVGLTPEDATTKLRAAAEPVLTKLGLPLQSAGLVLGVQSTQENVAVPGSILAQDPAADANAPLFSAISFTVAVPLSAKVPNLLGQAKAAVPPLLTAQGLTLGNVTAQQTALTADTVVGQDPAPDTVVAKGSTVDVRIATPITTQVPNFTGKNLAYAKEVLASAQLILGAGTTKASTQPTGTILDQTPLAGTSVAVGSQVAYSITGSTVAVPNLSAMTQDKARQALNAVNLPLGAVSSAQSTQAAGTVVAQSPAPGEQVLTGTPVAITLAIALQVTVPSILQMNQDQATNLLASVQLKLAVIGQAESSQQPNSILTQNPAAGQVIVAGSTVNVTVSVPLTSIVPSVLKQTQAVATAALASLNLSLVVSGNAVNDLSAGLIISQVPNPGTKVVQGTTVTVVLSLGPKVTVPNLVGSTIEDAQAIARSLGLVLSITTRVAASDGIVLGQSPAPKILVDPNATVHVVVSVSREIIKTSPALTTTSVVRGIASTVIKRP